MTTSLIALTGPLKGQAFEIGDATTIGRHRSNGLRIPDLEVSRHHCVVERTGDGVRLRDLGSADGTFVNGRPVHEVDLEPGDLVLVASSTFLFTVEAEREAGDRAIEPVELADMAVDAETAMRFAVDDSVFLHPEKLRRALKAESRLARSLAALIEIGTRLGVPAHGEAFGGELLERILKVIPADRAALLEVEAGEVIPMAHRHASSRPDGDSFRISRTVVERVLRDREALVWESRGDEKHEAESVASAGLKTLVCVPLLSGERTLGMLYLDSRRPDVTFGEDDRQLLTAIAAMASGALEGILRVRRLERENERLQAAELGHGLIGESAAMRRVYELLTRAARSSSTILILGESGTGKELAARAVHAASPRSASPFVAINCATLSETLLESELFGHEKGAFTGAVARTTGKLELADGGTLFLDEVGELPLALQARLLRVLQERSFERVGGTRPITVDIRLIAATNRDLGQAVRDGAFREDLYYRLNVISVTLPPLRERREDVPLLASHFAAHHGRAIRGRPLGISPEARASLAAYDWPGNVRELANAIERAVVLGEDDVIRPWDLPEDLAGKGESKAEETGYHAALTRTKKRLIAEAVRESGGNVTRAAELLKLHPNHLHRLITNLELRSELAG